MYATNLIDIDEGTRLCGENRQLYLRILSQFPADTSYSALLDAVEHGDSQRAFLHAHSLKGLAAQLALPALCRAAGCACIRLKAENGISPACTADFLPGLKAVYADTLLAIKALS